MKYLLFFLLTTLAFSQSIGVSPTAERTGFLHKANATARTSAPPTETKGRIVWQDSDNTLWLKNAVSGAWEQFPDFDVIQAIQPPPTLTGNTANRNSLIKDVNGKTYAIDSNGDSMQLGGAEEIVDVSGATLPINFPVTTIPGTPLFTPATPAMTGMTYAITDGTSLVFAKWNGTQYISAPTPDASWGLFGNGGTTQATNFIGTTNNVGLSIRTNNTIRATVTAAGNVGIGTTAPSVPLHVSRGSSGEIIRMQSTGNNSFMSWVQGGTRSGYWGDGTGVDDRIQLIAEKAGGLQLGATHASGDIRFSTAGTDRGMWLDNGNLGVGNLIPSTRLHITTGTANDSGLRMENLTSASPTTAGQAIGVDATGKVVTIAAGGTYTAGNGLQLTGTTFSALLDPTTNPALTNSAAGLKLTLPTVDTIYTADGTLAGNRVVDGGGFNLQFDNVANYETNVVGDYTLNTAGNVVVDGDITVLRGNTALRLGTPNQIAATATNGQVLTLTNAATGAVEYTTPAATTVVAAAIPANANDVTLAIPAGKTADDLVSLTVKELGNFPEEIGTTSWRDDGAGNIVVELLGSPTTAGQFQLRARW